MRPDPRLILLPLLLALGLLAQTPAWAAEYGIARPAQLEAQQQSYFERPDILQIQAQAHPKLGWQAWRQAHLEAAAAFLELYPTEHLYFLARDAELLYDAVRLISRDDLQTLARLHLVNVSRANMRHKHLLEYLAQEGITAERLRSDASFQPIFVDTGFSGTIPRVIRERMPENVRDRLKTHLLVSSNADMPSLRSFLLPINPAINGSSPSSMRGTIVGYEHIARATDRSDAYRFVNGEWHPISSATSATDGQVNSSTAQAYQEDLKHFLHSPAGRSMLQARRQLWRELRSNWLTHSQKQWTDFLKARLANSGAESSRTEAAIRDFLEWARLIGHFAHPNAPIIPPSRIGLSSETGSQLSNKWDLIHQYPQWASILENPDTRIPALLKSGKVSTLGAILDVIEDDEIKKIALTAIAEKLNIASVYALAEALIENIADNSWILDLFARPETAQYPDLLRLAIEKATPMQMGAFAGYVFSHEHWSEHPEFLRLAIERAPPESMLEFAKWVFKEYHWGNHPELLRLAIEKSPQECMYILIEHVLNHPLWNTHPLRHTFLEACNIADPDQRRAYLRERLGPYPWEGMPAQSTAAIQPTATAQVSTTSPPGPGQSLSVGARVSTLGGRTLEILNEAVTGKRGRVYRARDVASSEILALKIAINSEAETLESIQSEVEKTARWTQLGVRHVPILEAHSQGHYVVRPWIEGLRADEWMREWAQAGSPANAVQLKRLRRLIRHVAKQGAYIGDLNPKNLIWSKGDWTIVDSGGISDRSVEEALERFIENISRRWLKALKNAELSAKKIAFCEKQMLKALE